MSTHLPPSLLLAGLACAPLAPLALAQQAEPAPAASQPGEDLTELSLEELLDLDVSVAARHEEKLSDTAAAVYVISGEELRRSGHTSLQEALRMVPGFHVTQWKTSGYDVTARGFTGSLSNLNESFANQLLLVIDGVSLYSPVMAGIWWPLADIPLQDVDRIEVLRGPGGTLWGANAMNGVVHVITKHPRDTQGLRLDANPGTLITNGDASYGTTLGENGWVRWWSSVTRHDALPNAHGQTFPEDWSIGSIGARADWDLGARGRVRSFATIYTSEFGEDPVDTSILGLPPFDYTPKNGGRALASWERGDEHDLQRVQAWYSVDHQKQFNFESDLQMADLEWTRRREITQRQALTLGAGYRLVQTDLGSPDGFVDFDPEFRRTHALRVFAQDEIQLPEIDSALIVGTQLEASTLGGLQLQPNLRWRTNLTPSTMLWAAISRAVRTPSLEEVDLVQHDPPTDPPIFVGNEDFKSETLLAQELGIRSQLGANLSADLALFYNHFDDLQSIELAPGGSALTFGNLARASAAGAELALDWQPVERWRLRASYTYFEMNFEADAASFEASSIDWKDLLVPTQHVAVRSYYDLGEHWEFDSGVYWVNDLDYFATPQYMRFDLRLGWNPSERLQFALGMQNAFDAHHVEGAPEGVLSYGADVAPNIYLSLRIRR